MSHNYIISTFRDRSYDLVRAKEDKSFVEVKG